jgi:hypothetical protein
MMAAMRRSARKKSAPRSRAKVSRARELDESRRLARDLARMMRMLMRGDQAGAHKWIKDLGDKDPQRALELFVEMLKYSRGTLQ